jgi:hypothetical protein
MGGHPLMATILRNGQVLSHKGTCDDPGCGTTFTEMTNAKRHVDRTGHTVTWDVIYRRIIIPPEEAPT